MKSALWRAATMTARSRRARPKRQESATGKPFTVSMISWIRYKHHIPGPAVAAGTLTVRQVCQRYGVSRWVVYYWIDRGLIPAHRKPGLPYAITITDTLDQQLREWVANSHRIPSIPKPR